jgi:hypothetical protein
MTPTSITTEKLKATATADLLGSTYWRATERFRGFEGTSGYGDTKAEALAHLDRLTAWTRKGISA